VVKGDSDHGVLLGRAAFTSQTRRASFKHAAQLEDVNKECSTRSAG
jgi:hypothetical protein